MSDRAELGAAPELSRLIGLRLSVIRRAVDLLNLQFGLLREVSVRRGGSSIVGELALHISGPWRIDGPELTLIGQQDLYRFAGTNEPVGWSYEQGNTRLDAELDAAFGPHIINSGWDVRSAGFEVTSTYMSRYGDLDVRFANGFAIRAFPSDVTGECWRLFEPGGNRDHFVIPDHE